VQRERKRSGASLIRDRQKFRIRNGPGSAAHHFAVRCARDTHIRASRMLATSIEPTVASVFAPRTRIEPDGTVEGYASLFGEIDAARDMMMRGAFAATLAKRGVNRVPMLFQHDPAEPVGVWLELTEDQRGLYARGRLIPEVARARELLSLLRAGAVDGLSIGFRTVKGSLDPKTRVRRLIAVDLWEISIVTFPLLAGARVRAVKHSPPRSQSGFALAERGAASRPTLSPARLRGAEVAASATQARARAERAWGRLAGAADAPASATPPSRRRERAPLRECRRHDGSLVSGRLRGWRGA
jgi:HK97 family phage prohead protease